MDNDGTAESGLAWPKVKEVNPCRALRKHTYAIQTIDGQNCDRGGGGFTSGGAGQSLRCDATKRTTFNTGLGITPSLSRQEENISQLLHRSAPPHARGDHASAVGTDRDSTTRRASRTLRRDDSPRRRKRVAPLRFRRGPRH